MVKKQKNITSFFESFIRKNSLFEDKKVLQSSYTPENIPHREREIEQVAHILAPALRSEKPSNLFIYGKTGTGKTLIMKHVAEKMMELAQRENIPLRIFYLNCKLKKIADTEYRLIAELARFFGKAIPPTGLPTDEVYNIFFQTLDKEKQTVILVLDEIDQLIKRAGDEAIYNLTRVNIELKNAQVSLVGISNDLLFADNLDPRIKSSLSEEELVFPPYNALQLQDILKKRATQAFREGILEEGVISKCAAYAAREHGDARRALELLRVAGELAERNNKECVTIPDLDEAEEKLERDRILDAVTTQPKQFQAALHAILLIHQKNTGRIFTGEVYEVYKNICQKTGLRPLTQRRLSDILAEFDMLGIINAKIISKGRYGRTREISVDLPEHLKPKVLSILKEGLHLET
ncbi:MAG: ORC1-type DNA replication protein [archaeon]